MITIVARTLSRAEIPAGAKVPVNVKVRLSEWAGRQHVLVHDGKRIVVRHGPKAITGTGESNLVMVCGTEAEIDAEVKRLGLVEGDDFGVVGLSSEPD